MTSDTQPLSPGGPDGASDSRKWVAVLLAGAATISLAPILLRYATDCGVGAVAVAFWRVALALRLLGGMSLIGRRVRATEAPLHGAARADSRAVMFAVLGGAFFGIDLMLYHMALVRTTMANATLMSNCAPVFVALAAWWLLGERFKRVFVVGLVLAIGGAVGLSLAERATERPGDNDQKLLGDLLAITSAVFYAGYQLCIKRARRSLRTRKTFTISIAASAAVLLPAALIAGESLVPSSDQWRVIAYGWAILLALGLVVQLGGQGSIVTAMRHLPVSFLTVVLLTQPVMVAVLGWALLGESLGGWHMLGAGGVLAGIYLARRGSTETKRAPGLADETRAGFKD